jgi:hypothetical protein
MIISFERILKFKAVLFVCKLMVFTLFGCLITANISACFNAYMKLLTYSENPSSTPLQGACSGFQVVPKAVCDQIVSKAGYNMYIGENRPITAKESQKRNSEIFLELVSGLKELFAHRESTNRPSIK